MKHIFKMRVSDDLEGVMASWRLWMRSPDLICTKMPVQVHNWFSFSLEDLKF